MVTLVEFLLARIAEDEEVVHGVYTEGAWGSPGALTDHEGVEVHALDSGAPVAMVYERRDARQVARFNPARTLADCQAKRRITQAVIDGQWAQFPDYDGRCVTAMKDAVAHLAAAYADHPDYRPEWRPAARAGS
jgi:hypothetical protein